VKRTLARIGLPIAAALVTSTIVAALALGAPPNQPPPQAANAQPIGQLTVGGMTIPVLSYSEGVSNPTTINAGGLASGKASFSSLNVMSVAGANMPKIHHAVADGTEFPTAVLTVSWTVGGGSASMKYELEEVGVESAQISGSAGAPSESLSLAFAKVKWTFTDANGSVTRGWNLITNTEIPAP